MATMIATGSLLLLASLAALSTDAQYVNNAPAMDLDEWWGPKELQGTTDSSIRCFKMKFDSKMVKDLKHRLRNRRQLAPPLEDVAFEYGFNSNQVEPWAQYWAEKYNFTERESYFNQFPHYKTNIQGLDIHFIRVKPEAPAGVAVLPLLVLHGWGGSFREFYDAIHLLTTPRDGYDFIFEVIVPSLPGFGFSDAAVRPGMGAAHMGVVIRNLMNRLGHDKFYIQGGDWGSVIGSTMSTLFPDEVLGFHSNFLQTLNAQTAGSVFVGATAAVQGLVSPAIVPILQEAAFIYMHATKPDTIGTMLTESPVSFLVYMLEKFMVSTRYNKKFLPDGGLHEDFTPEQLLDNFMVYWASNSITTSVRIYAENFNAKYQQKRIDDLASTVPTWVLIAKYEFLQQPVNRLKYPNVVGVTQLDDGGHFLAFQLPEKFTADVFKAVNAFREYDTSSCSTVCPLAKI